jgi:hypothetical protein
VTSFLFDLTSRYKGDVADVGGGIAEKWTSLTFTWSGRSFSLDIADSDRLGALQVVWVGMFIFFKDIGLEGSPLQPDRCTTRPTENTWISEGETAPRRWADVSAVDVHVTHF